MKNLKKLVYIFTLTTFIFGCKNELKENSTTSNEDTVSEEVDQKIEDNAEEIKDYKTNSVIAKLMFTDETKSFVRFLISAELIDKLSIEEGPFTILAPSNDAFNSMNAAKLTSFQDQKNKELLFTFLNSHIIEGNLDTVKLVKEIKKNNGKYTIKTISGATLTASKEDSKIIITDDNGSKASIGKSDIIGSNGVVHVLDAVLAVN